MKKSVLFIPLAGFLCLAACNPERNIDPDLKGEADVMFIGNIITMDKENSTAKAMTVKNGKVQYVGTVDEARQYCGDRTEIQEYPDEYIYPGFIEGHVHGMEVAGRFAQVDLASIDDDPKTTMDDFVALMEQDVKNNPDRKIYKGAGWSVKGEVLPTAAMLDAISPDNVPMVLSSVDGHSMWINTCAIRKYKVDDKANIEKYGTDCIRVDADGFPTGYISENAMNLVRPALLLSKDEIKENLLKWQDKAFATGLTGVVEAAVTTDGNEKEAWMELAKEGRWKLRTYAMECVQNPMPDEKFWSDLNKVLNHHKQYQDEYFKVYGVKIFVDGVVEARTAWLLEPYSNDPPNYYGMKNFPEASRIAEAVEFANKNGMNVHFHTVGDGAARTAVEGIIRGQQAAGVTDARNTMAHLQIIQPEEIQKMADNNIIPVCAPLWVPIDSVYNVHEREYLGERVNTEYRIKSFFTAGCKVNFHSDYPVSPNFSLPLTVYTAVKRTAPVYGEKGILNIAEAVTAQQALEAMTVNVAWQIKEEKRLGQLKSGMIANLSIFDVDFINDPIENVPDAKVIATYIDGKPVYGEKRKK